MQCLTFNVTVWFRKKSKRPGWKHSMFVVQLTTAVTPRACSPGRSRAARSPPTNMKPPCWDRNTGSRLLNLLTAQSVCGAVRCGPPAGLALPQPGEQPPRLLVVVHAGQGGECEAQLTPGSDWSSCRRAAPTQQSIQYQSKDTLKYLICLIQTCSCEIILNHETTQAHNSAIIRICRQRCAPVLAVQIIYPC